MNNEKNTNGIKNFLWAVQQQVDAHISGRKIKFGNGRPSSFNFKKEPIEISTDEIQNLPSTDDDDEDHEGE